MFSLFTMVKVCSLLSSQAVGRSAEYDDQPNPAAKNKPLQFPSAVAVPPIISSKPVYIGCRTKRQGPRSISSCPLAKSDRRAPIGAQ